MARRICTTELITSNQIIRTENLGARCVDHMISWIRAEAQEKGSTIDIAQFVSLMNFNVIGNEKDGEPSNAQIYQKKNISTILVVSELSSFTGIVVQMSTQAHTLLELFTAGVDTTTAAIEWAMSELLCNPKTMEKVQSELEQ
ncbi:hypothetical protein IFM89_035883 [Coptis chinensis]|uniref:Cytochrome P450 n=1 Tax=Coptis chinensis TaxID=261450 RepID=A0A835H1P5_9MAGN|nr:hypothetical protein IFM89_035883 [Coptis chinensis]